MRNLGDGRVENVAGGSKCCDQFSTFENKVTNLDPRKNILIDTESADEVKLLIEKFLHREGLDSYRVLSESGVVRLVPEEKQEAPPNHIEDKVKASPFPPPSSERLPLMQTASKLWIRTHTSSEQKEETELGQKPNQDSADGGAGGI